MFVASPLLQAGFAQTPSGHDLAIAPLGNYDVVVLPDSSARAEAELKSGAIQAHSFETGNEGIHLVVFEGETYRASTPLEGEFSRMVFDPIRRQFVPLLSNIRVELEEFGQLESIAEVIGARTATPFQALGFAIIELPETRHPLDAVRQLRAPPFSLEASIRV